MIRGTTPTVTIEVGCDLTGYDCYATFEWDRGQLTKSGDALEVVGGAVSTVTVRLTQADTLSFPEDRTVKVQLRAVKDGDAIATEVGTLTASEVLLEEEIPLEEETPLEG